MSFFYCDECGATVICTPQRNITGCKHYPANTHSQRVIERMERERVCQNNHDRNYCQE